jgi:hypothetical protein
VLDVVDPDVSVDRRVGDGTVARTDDVERAVRPDLLAEQVLQRGADLAASRGSGAPWCRQSRYVEIVRRGWRCRYRGRGLGASGRAGQAAISERA